MGRPKKIKTDAVGTTQCKATTSIETDEKIDELITSAARDIKLAVLKKIMNETNRDRGSTTLKFATDEETPDRISFGDRELDELTGGGIPHKRFSIIWGPKSAGKTTLCYNLIAEAQKQNKICAYIDMERSFDKTWAKRMGVDLEKLVLGTEYQTAEAAMDDFITITKEKAADFVILDSVQALSPKGEQESKKGKEKSLEDDTMALLARKLSQFFRISSANVYKGNVAILLIGQARTNLGGFIAFDSLSGGHALAHWSTLTMNVTRGAKSEAPTEKIKVDGKTEEKIVGFDSVIKLEKVKISSVKGDKTTPEGTIVHIPFFFETGFKRGDK